MHPLALNKPVLVLFVVAVLFVLIRGRTTKLFNDPHAPPLPGGDEGVRALIDRGEMIAAIKLYRDLHHVDLKGAKDAVDALAAGRTPASVPAPPPAGPEIVAMVRAGDVIGAIQRYREQHGVDLKTAKDAVTAAAHTL